MQGWIREYLRRLRRSCWMRKSRVALILLSPLLLWLPSPARVVLHLLLFAHLSAWLYGVFAPNSRLFGPIFDRGSGKQKWVALTFDDGPSLDHTPLILDTLKEFGIRGTFFVVGAKAKAQIDLLRRIIEEGHALGNHTWSHPPHLAFEGVVGRRRIKEEIQRTASLLESITGRRCRLFRPPQGFKNHLILESCAEEGMVVVGYTARPPYHANGLPSSVLVERVIRDSGPGSIINFHDGWVPGREWDREEMRRTLSGIIQGLKEEGYRFVTVEEMVGRAESDDEA
jgi:peptidoglycan/xylan/chitin deacetylase (PgdA/CDA1 family)